MNRPMYTSSLFKSCSQISTDIRCTNCGVNIVRIIYKQCTLCHQFNLCEECEAYPYDELELRAREIHITFHHDKLSINSQYMKLVSVRQAMNEDTQRFDRKFHAIMREDKIQNDIDMSIVMGKLKKLKNEPDQQQQQQENMKEKLCSMIIDYHMRAFDRKINILNLDGGGIRGYMPIRILEELIIKEYIPGRIPSNVNREEFIRAQLEFTNKFDYFAGTSTGCLIAFCLAINYNILDLKDIYKRASYYFNRNLLGPVFCSKYNPSRIHEKIDEIINRIELTNGKKLTAENATLLDIHNYLNPNAMISDKFLNSAIVRHGNLLEFVDDEEMSSPKDNEITFRHVKREKVLLITAYNATKDIITIFNTSYAKHWPYRIADVLKATMAAPTYFPPQHIHKRIIRDGHFIEDPHPKPAEIFIDGGVFANDPELVAMWAIRMQWKKLVNYHLLSIGTGTYNGKLSPTTRGGYPGWIRTDGLAINILMDATRSSTEIMGNNLAKFNNIRRMKFNYRIIESMSLDDPTFIQKFNDEWESLKTGDDFKALLYFYNKYINKQSK